MQGVFRIDIIRKIALQADVTQGGIPFKGVCSACRRPKQVTVIAVYCCKVEKQFFRKNMAPSECPCAIAPVHTGKIIAEYIPAEISWKKDLVIVVYNVIDFGIDIIKIQAVILKGFVWWKRQEEVGVSPASRHNKWTAVFLNRAFNRKPAGYNPYPSVHLEPFTVSFIHPYIKHRCKPSSVICRYISFI